ncbi:hypothetical protein [Acidovorax sp. NCPPB 3576]|uniref:hypothetical protein n=1 Tax=Acidovorax sp. NCPPB 3576 TaxID=2940488 RepID=UPI00234BE4A6|nr:hypothetical protein [Acidovorax sp. NCPPB 3576]WCM90459.1 hypothetical protein M5C98_10770 [Acidovorax sp. NCPPB 3576]
MPSIQKRGDKFLAQVRIKQGGVVIFSESKVFEKEVMAKTWGDRPEAKVKKEGPAKHAASKITVGELVDRHLAAQIKYRPLLGRSTIHNHQKIADAFRKVKVSDLTKEFARRNQHHQTSIDMIPIYSFALACPRRLGELGKMGWKDIDTKRRTILLRQVKHPKKKEYHD